MSKNILAAHPSTAKIQVYTVHVWVFPKALYKCYYDV